GGRHLLFASPNQKRNAVLRPRAAQSELPALRCLIPFGATEFERRCLWDAASSGAIQILLRPRGRASYIFRRLGSSEESRNLSTRLRRSSTPHNDALWNFHGRRFLPIPVLVVPQPFEQKA